MKINFNKTARYTFKDIPCGDLFAIPETNEMYVKVMVYQTPSAYSLRHGSRKEFPANTPVRKVKSINIEFED